MALTEKNNQLQLGAGLAGAGGGTGLIAIVNLIPDGNAIKDVAVFLAPSVAIIVSMLWIYLTSRLDEALADRRLALELNKAEVQLKQVESDPHSSEELKQEMRKKIEALRLLKFSIHTKRVAAIVES